VTSSATSLYRNRDFMLLWSGQTLSVLGSRISHIAFPLLVLALTRSPERAGLVGFFGALPYLLLQLPAGGLVDRWDRKRTMVACDVGRALALASIAVALWAGRPAFGHILAVAFLEGALFVFFGLAEEAALPKVVSKEQLPSAIAQNEAKTRGASLAGQPLGGLQFSLRRALPFLVDAMSYAVSVVTLLLIRTDFQGPRTDRRQSLHREIAEGFGWLWRQPFLRTGALLVGYSNFIFQALVLVVIVLARARGASASLVGVILGFMGGGGLLGSFVAPWLQRRLPPKLVMIGANWVWAALLPLLAVVPEPILLGPILAGMAFVGPAWNVVFGAYQLTLTPDRLLGRVNSVTMLLAWGSIPLGSLAAGFLLGWAGAVPSTWVLAGAMTFVAVAATVSPAMRRAPTLSEVRTAT
jgi:predicted MFS family arabinose efflux permease